jgi:hypothetical protein
MDFLLTEQHEFYLVDLPLFPFVFPLIVNYRDEFIGEQQPTSSVLYNGEAKGQRTGGRRSDGAGKRWGWTRYMFYRRNQNIQWPKVNYSYVIHPTSESSM